MTGWMPDRRCWSSTCDWQALMPAKCKQRTSQVVELQRFANNWSTTSAQAISRSTTTSSPPLSKPVGTNWSWPSASTPYPCLYRICAEFNDKYSNADEAQLLQLDEDLNQLGPVLEDRFKQEDRLVKALQVVESLSHQQV